VVNQSPRVAFETVARLAGINILWDPDMNPPLNQARNVTVDLTNSTLEEALDYLGMLTKFFWQPLSSNTIFVTNDTVNKRRDFEQQVLKVFYLSNINSQQELQEVINAVRTLTEINRIMPFNSQNAIIVRGEADRVAMAEKIISDLDKPRSEVVIDILVLNASNTFSRQITTALASTGLNVPVTFAPQSGITTTTTTPTGGTATTTTGNSGVIPLSQLGHLSSADYSIALPGALLQAALSDATTKVLQSPEVRSVEGQKASLKIGDREPTATGSFQPGIGGVGINPLVNTQFTYIDVGVNVDITPRVHDNGDVSMHVELDISDVSGQVNLGGINQPIISQKKVIHDIRLKEGEINLLGGLIQQQEDKTVTGIPGLSSIPLIRRLFSGESVDHSRTELMIALIPHVVRRPGITAEDLRGIGVGNATTIKLNFGPRASEEQAAPPSAQAAPPTAAGPSPAAPPATAPPIVAPVAPPNRNVPPPPPGPAATVQFQPGQVETSVNGTFTASLALQGVNGATAVPLQIQFDPKLLRLNDVGVGDLMAQGGQQPVVARNIQNDAGTAAIQISRPQGAAPVSGDGVLLNLTFQAIGRGAANVTVSNLGITNAQGQVAPGGGPPLLVRIQ
jgi:general secretion pathway protein D